MADDLKKPDWCDALNKAVYGDGAVEPVKFGLKRLFTPEQIADMTAPDDEPLDDELA